jgi:hypothetical protein
MNAPTPNLPAERKPQLMAGAPVAALVPQSLEEAFRLAGALAASGMAPRGIDKPEQIMVAIMAGAELGLAPFQSLQSFALVNGKPTLYGDGLMAVVRAHGVRVKEWLEGEGEQMVAHCIVTRPETGEEIERSFTVANAKKAQLWGKQGPWQQYPQRMLQMRARALALRDGCADMLRGIQVREEVEDYDHGARVVSGPKPSGLRDRLQGPGGEGFNQHHAPEEPVEFAERAEEIGDAEFETADDPAPDVNDSAEPQTLEDAEPIEEWAVALLRTVDTFTDVDAMRDAWNLRKDELKAAKPDMFKQLNRAVVEHAAALAGV